MLPPRIGAMLRTILMRLSRRPWKFLLPVVVLLFFAFTLSRTRRPEPDPARTFKAITKSYFPPLKYPSNKLDVDYCENFPKKQLDEVQVVLKTGAGDREKIRAQLQTVSSCISNIIIVSDHDEKIGDYRIIDVLAELPPTYAVKNTDFQAYDEHKKAHADGDTANYAQQGWKLDRFKYLPMVDKAYEVNPKAKWFVFMESDVYFLWDTLFRLLEQYDYTESHYFGAPAAGSAERTFAYSGAGFVLSQGLMKRLLPQKPTGGFSKLSQRYEEWAKDDTRGDAVLAHAILNATDTKLESLSPTFSGEDLRTIKIDADRWCVPLLSLHRISPEQMEALWKWERTRPYNKVCTNQKHSILPTAHATLQKPFVYSSLLAYTHSFLRKGPTRDFWDNLSEAPVPNDRPAHRNAGSCGDECSKDPHCLQHSYSQTVCRFANYIKLGNPVDENNGGQGEFVSGWNLGKMAELGFKLDEKSDMHDTCNEANWLKPQVR